MAGEFQYQESLSQNSNGSINHSHQIRLLELQAASRSKHPIQCNLILIDLDTNPEYTALSYTWGKPNPQSMVTITLCGQSFRVSPNLAAALRRIRHNRDVIRIWIDAICINQEDDMEKASQIRLMGEIYSRASSVTIWLGESGERSDKAFKMIKRWGNLRDIEAFMEITGFNGPRHPVADGSFGVALRYTDEKDWTAVKQLLSRDWWSRIWVVQEVALAQNAILVCGKDELDWEYLNRTIDLVTQLLASNILDTIFARTLALAQKSDVISMCRLHQRSYSDLVEVLDLTANRYDATNQRDLIYGLLGLVSEKSLNLEVHYERENQEYKVKDWWVFADLVRCTAEQRHSLRLLCRAGIGIGDRKRRQNLDLPSWVPDLGPLTSKARHWDPAKMICSRAGGSTKPQVQFSPDLRIIKAIGVIVDKIAVAPGQGENLRFKDLMLLWCLSATLGDDVYLTGIPTLQAFFRTLICYLAPSTVMDLFKGNLRDTMLGFMLFLGTMSCSFLQNDAPEAFSQFQKQLKKYKLSEPVSGLATYLFLAKYYTDKSQEFMEEMEKAQDIEAVILEPLLGPINSEIRLKWLPDDEIRQEIDQTACFNSEIFNIALPGNAQRIMSSGYTTSSFAEPHRGAHLGQTSANTRMEQTYGLHCRDVLERFQFYMTENGYMGVGPKGLREGDDLCILYGCPMPLVIREKDSRYELVGSCYVQGAMQGELISKCAEFETTSIELY